MTFCNLTQQLRLALRAVHNPLQNFDRDYISLEVTQIAYFSLCGLGMVFRCRDTMFAIRQESRNEVVCRAIKPIVSLD